MKTGQLIAASLLLAATARAGELPPGDFAAFIKSTTHNATEFFDEARRDQNGWVSLFGHLDGGVYFFTDLFTLKDTTTVNVWWDFTGTDYSMRWIVADTEGLESVFRVPLVDRISGFDSVTMPGPIQSVSFYGTGPETSLAESGATIGLLFLACLMLIALKAREARQ